jgi:hypothetical protein
LAARQPEEALMRPIEWYERNRSRGKRGEGR